MSCGAGWRAVRTSWGRLPALAFALAALIPARAAAQGTVPPAMPHVTQEVVVTATATPVPVELLSRTVTVVTREDLEQLGVSSLIEALRLQPGVDPRARGPRDVQTDFAIRGATFGQVLVLLDGFRLNNSQSAHHNGEIPAAFGAIDRIEVLAGAGSAVHGADALGGTINVISRDGDYRTAAFSAGQHGYVAAQAAIAGHVLPDDWSLSAWASRSSGFMFDRDFALGGAALRGSPAPGWIVGLRHQRRAFGANGFYGPSPSKEWTDQTMATVGHTRTAGRWTTTTRGAVRNHGDHFRWDIHRPGFAENRHRTNAVEATVAAALDLGGGRRFTSAVSAGGDWLTSSNLGDRAYGRGGLTAELLAPLTSRTTVQAGLRWDGYSAFGDALNPSVSAVAQLTPAVRVRAALGRAFRIPSFTELYYSDPANLGSPDLVAEHGWSLDSGVEWTSGGWSASFSPFRRWDSDVIDWVRPTATDLWRSTNVRDVTATGAEASITRRWHGTYLRGNYSVLTMDAPALTLLSKYVLEYARHQAGISAAFPVAAGLRASVNVDHRRRLDGQVFTLVAARLSRQVANALVFLDATNLLDERYREVVGVDMPGRWITVGVEIR